MGKQYVSTGDGRKMQVWKIGKEGFFNAGDIELRSLKATLPSLPTDTMARNKFIDELRFVRIGEFRVPQQHEFYLSGCDENGDAQAWAAPQNRDVNGQKFHIVKPLFRAVQVTVTQLVPLT